MTTAVRRVAVRTKAAAAMFAIVTAEQLLGRQLQGRQL